MKNLKYWLLNKYLNWKWAEEESPTGLFALWWTVKGWWKMRPMRVDCASGCGTRMWHNGPAERNSFCSESCAYVGAGAFNRAMDDEIPF